MLRRLDLNHFKCFEQLRLPLAPLTLLSGTNASGKSSVLQAVVLLHQTAREHEWSTRLMLNGGAVRLGTVQDVVDQVHGRRGVRVGLVDDLGSVHWSFAGAEREEMALAVDAVTIDGVAHPIDRLRHLLPDGAYERLGRLATRLRDVSYVTAERVGPRESYPLEDPQGAPVVGPRGEHAVSVLYRGRASKVLPELVIEGIVPTRLHQVVARMDALFPGCALDVQPVKQANAVTLGIRTSPDTEFHRPIHVGFGLTQVLPIVVAALSARPDDLLLIENPEVHLHPGGQARMGTFLAEVAAAGVQVILETHSDHVLNGIRRAVRAGTLGPDRVALHFFQPRGGDGEQVVSPVLDAGGNVDFWPEGFFDQFDKDMNHFAGWGD